MLIQGHSDREFEQQSEIDPCVFFRKDAIVIISVDDCVIFSNKGLGFSDKWRESLKRGMGILISQMIKACHFTLELKSLGITMVQ